MDSSPTVELWWTSVGTIAPRIERLVAMLDDDDRRRAERFRVESARHRFVTARAMLRALLARAVGVAPTDLRFGEGERGKPYLSSPAAPGGPRFNLSHSGDTAVVALARSEVGVDVESVRVVPRVERLAARFLSAAEQAWLGAVPAGQRDAAFLTLWTCKEAYLKAMGSGISMRLKAIEVDAEEPTLLRVGSDPEAPGRWTLLRAVLPEPAVCTVAVGGEGWQMAVREVTWSSSS